MRARAKKAGISIHAIAGCHSVVLGLDAANEQARSGVLGFSIKRIDHTQDEAFWLRGFKSFEHHADEIHPGTSVSSWHSPFQDFLWGDYTVKPGHQYTYVVVPRTGTLDDMQHGPAVSIDVRTEREDEGTHAVYFNRGVAGSQAYARRFGNARPDDVGVPALRWLSRGLAEGLADFICEAKGKAWSLRASVYEFNYLPIVKEFKRAIDRGVDVQIVFDGKGSEPGDANRAALDEAGIGPEYATPRTTNPSYISHNKFIVLLHRGEPIEVWTGSTNITEGGIFGHSNVGHIVRDEAVATAYLEYWKQLVGDPTAKDLRPWNDEQTPVPESEPAPCSITPIFSPRGSMEALDWYADRMEEAKSSVFFTAAFGICDPFEKVLEEDKPYLRYVLLDKPGKGIDLIRPHRCNRISIGGVLKENVFDEWLHELWKAERLTGLNAHVQYIHTKYMLIDPMSDDPWVISGSANFSRNSTLNNDENMLIIRGNLRVADMYLTEFMRMFDHFRFRGTALGAHASERTGPHPGLHLLPDDSWQQPFFTEGDPKQRQRLLFA